MRLKLPNVAACCIAMAICLACFPRACWAQSNTQNKSSTQNKRFDLQKLERQIKQVVATVQPATVAIIEPNQPEFSGATGVIVSSEGHILTAGHCVFQPGTKFKIVLPDGRNFPAVGMGMEPSLDCGLIKIESEKLADAKLPTVKMGWSSELKVNQPCISLGHSGGFNRKRGAVIRFGRIAETLSPSNAMIRSTCLMEPGDSGGPLFDLKGRLIGIHSMIDQKLENNFEVPIDLFRCYWNQLNQQKKFRVTQTDEFPNFGMRLFRGSRMFGFPQNNTSRIGTKIRSTTEDGWASRQGLKKSDRIVKYDGQQIQSSEQLNILLSQSIVQGKAATVIVERRDSEDVTIELDFSQLEGLDENSKLKKTDATDQIAAIDQLEKLPEFVTQTESELDDFCVSIQSKKGKKKIRSMGSVVNYADQNWIIGKSSLIGDSVMLTYEDQSEHTAKVVARNEKLDLAVLSTEQQSSAGIVQPVDSEIDRNSLGSFVISPNPKNKGEVSVVGAGPFAAAGNGFLGVTPKFGKNGAEIQELVPGGAAEKAGLKIGDVITVVDQTPIAKPTDLIVLLSKQAAGDLLTFKVKRAEDEIEMEIKLAARPEEKSAPMGLGHAADFFAGGKSRVRTGFPKLLVHDGHVLPRECGGPVFDCNKKFIGINIARFSRTQTYLMPSQELFLFLKSALSQIPSGSEERK